jgi:hypothetical protein
MGGFQTILLSYQDIGGGRRINAEFIAGYNISPALLQYLSKTR